MEWKLFGYDLSHALKKVRPSGQGGATRSLGRREISPARDWLILLAASIVCALGIALYDGSLFLSINNGELGEIETTNTPAPKLNEARLDATLEKYQERENVYNALREAPPALSDPAR